MKKNLGIRATLLCALTWWHTAAPARDFFEVVTVTPSQVIDHEVEAKGPFDNDKIETFLTGPQLFSHAVGFEGKPAPKPQAYLNWYKITKPTNQPRQTISVRDALRGDEAYEITIQSAAYLLSAAQRITSGAPAPIPDDLGYFEAYEIVDGPQINRKVALTGTFGPGASMANRAVLLCVPIEQWHHDEHVTVKNASECLLIYELLPEQHTLTVATIDQFGLNKLETETIKWLGVPATVLEHGTIDAR